MLKFDRIQSLSQAPFRHLLSEYRRFQGQQGFFVDTTTIQILGPNQK